MRRRSRPGCAFALALAVVALVVPGGPTAAAPAGPAPTLAPAAGRSVRATQAQAPPPGPNGSMALAYQTPWMAGPGDFTMRLRLGRPSGPGTQEVAVTVYPAVGTRSEFDVTVGDKVTAPSVLPVQAFPLASLTPDANGEVTVVLHLTDRLSLGKDDGVFPVRVELRERGTGRVMQRFTTHAVYLPAQHTGAKLGLSLVVPLHTAAGLPASGNRQLKDLDGVAAATSALEALRTTPFALAPTPETLASLASSTDERAVNTLKILQQRAAATTVLAGTYVPTNLPALIATGQGKDAAGQVTRGATTVADVLKLRPDARTWLAREPVDNASLSLLARRGVDRVVAVESDLQPVATQKLTLTQPFLLDAGDRQVQAVVADAGLARHLDNQVDPVLGASRLVADLAVIYLDQPAADRRAVVAVGPTGWRADKAFLDTAVGALAQSPILEPLSLDAVFSTVGAARTEQGRPLVRTAATAPGSGIPEVASGLGNARRRLDSLGSVLGTTSSFYTALEERMLVAESLELRTSRQRQSYIDAVLSGIDRQRRDIRMPATQSITLTARRGEIPVTFQNRTGVPARVVVTVQSDKLDFPRGSTVALDLERRNTTERFSVVSRTSGAFPLRIQLESPDGNMVIGQARLTVRSTAASGVGLIVSLGAALFLAVWWGRHALRGRRARRLVPA